MKTLLHPPESFVGSENLVKTGLHTSVSTIIVLQPVHLLLSPLHNWQKEISDCLSIITRLWFHFLVLRITLNDLAMRIWNSIWDLQKKKIGCDP